MEFIVGNDNVARALKIVGRFLQKHHIIKTARSIMYYEKPSEKRIRKEKESVKRRKRNRRLSYSS